MLIHNPSYEVNFERGFYTGSLRQSDVALLFEGGRKQKIHPFKTGFWMLENQVTARKDGHYIKENGR